VIGRRLPRAIATLVAAATVLVGCSGVPMSISAQVPTSGPIEQGEQVGVQREDQFIRVIAREPRPGMTPEQVVQGFLDASASFDDDHAVAREYLTAPASANWDTGAGVTVYEGAPTLTALGDTVDVTAGRAGEIAANGRYEASGPAAQVDETFVLRQVDGEWRIDALPQGLLLSSSDVDRAFRSFSVFFFDPLFQTLVPDARMIPVVGPGLATTLVRGLVSGPSDWLEPAVRTGFPAGVGLNIDAVPVESGIAHVDLTVNARKADDRTRRAMSQQIVWTLRQLPDVQAVDITAGGQPLVVPSVPSPQPRDVYPGVDPDAMGTDVAAYATRLEGVVRLTSGEVTPVAGAAGAGEPPLVSLAVAQDGQSVAGTDTEGSVWQGRLIDGSPMIRVRPPGSPTGLAFDGTSLWVVDGGALLAVQPDGTSARVTVSGLAKQTTLVAAVPSRDGTRAALIVRRGPRTGLMLARIVRGGGAVGAVTVSAPVRVESRLAEVTSVAWASSDTLAVLGAESAGSLQVFEVSLARGVVLARGAPNTPVSVAAAPGLPMLAGSADGLVYALDAGTWTERVRGSAPAYPN
jgi:hypothetical protein